MKDLVDDLAQASAADIGRHLAANKGGAVDVATFFLDRIAAQTSPVFLDVSRARALDEAQAADDRLAKGVALSPLDGVPIAWKDLVDVAGSPTTVASAIYKDAPIATDDAPVVQNATRAGMISLGKLNLAEFAYSALGQNPHFGTPHNPNAVLPRAPGGSSSGSGVAVAAGLAPAALGSDTAGSVRIPASFCGVVGLKTSEGHLPTEGCFALSRTQDTLGPLAHSVEDCALLYSVLTGQPGDVITPADLAGLRVVAPTGVVTNELSDAVGAAFESSLARLQNAGVSVQHMALSALDEAAWMLRDLGSIVAAEAFVEHRDVMDSADAARMDQRIRARIEIGRTMTAADLVALQRQRAHGMAQIRAALDGAMLVMPTTADTAPALSDFEGDDAAFTHHNLRANRNTSIGSFYDLPGVAIPNGQDGAGLPTSFLMSGPSGADKMVLQAGMAAEATIRSDTT